SQIQEAFVDFVSFVVKKTIRFVSSFLVIIPNLGEARSSEVAINNLSYFWVKVNETTRLREETLWSRNENRMTSASQLGKTGSPAWE
ncbi:MAG: hypothetical protein VYC82_01440, partial [Verrucomicrobiota bacterium]|nr:hypothetical protein [Verrucomicrobiota bacterium]